MRAFHLTAVLSLLPLGLFHAEETKPAGPAFEKLTLTRSDKTGHYLGQVSVEGHEGRFLVDSGAGTVAVLSSTFAQSLGTPLTELEGGSGVGGAIRMQKANLEQFKISGFPRLKLKGVQVVDLSHSTFEVGGAPFAPQGLIGAGLLDLCNAVFDPKASVLLIAPHGTPDRAYFESSAMADFVTLPLLKGGMAMPFVDITLKGKTRTFLIDTGAGGNSLLPDFASELDLKTVSKGGSFGGAGDKTVEDVSTVLAEQCLVGGKFELGKTHFLVHPIGATVVLPPDKKFGGILGTKTLASIGALIDFGSYSLAVPSSSVAEAKQESTPKP